MKRSIELKIKIKNLADEARTIRVEENKLHGMEKWNLQHHRKTVVRDAARRSLIAYLHIWGRDPAPHISSLRWTRVLDHKPIKQMIERYGDDDAVARWPDLERQMS